jgi:UDP-galactopyranose mutase
VEVQVQLDVTLAATHWLAPTRVTEFKYRRGQRHPSIMVVYEFPGGDGEPYTPLRETENAALYERYRALDSSTAGVHCAASSNAA